MASNIHRSHKRQAGFTILELTIATAVFSIILLVVAAGIVSFTRSYIKGSNQSKTQESVRSIADDVARSLQFASSYEVGPDSAGWSVRCVDNIVYSYRVNQRFASDNAMSHALVRSPRDGACVAKTTFDNTRDRELMGHNMRLTNFQITDNGNGTFVISINAIHGEEDITVGGKCGSGSGSEYCAVAGLTTTVQRRL